MPKPLTLTLPYPPSVNHYWRMVMIRERPTMLISKDGREYKKSVGRACQVRGVRPMDGLLSVRFTVFRPRRVGDLDNTQKSLFDALSGHAWHDDSQIVEIHAFRDDDKKNPRVEIEITPAGVGEQILDFDGPSPF